jgi:Cu(I)/Ag(I) efflux system membrane fusion protein
MDLVPRHAAAAALPDADTETAGFRLENIQGLVPVTIPTDRLQRIGVRHQAVRRAQVQDDIHAVATLQADEARIAVVSPRTSGWLQAVAPLRAGDRVKSGEWLASLFSHEVHAAEAEFQVAGAALAGMATDSSPDVQRAAAERLRGLGLSGRRSSTKSARGIVSLRSPRDGVVMERKAAPGQYVGPQESVFVIGDLTEVQLVADVPAAAAPRLHAGDMLQFRARGLPDIAGRIAAIEPTARPEAQTVRVRALLDNAGGLVRPGLVGEAVIQGPEREALLIPDEAVIDVGTVTYVFRWVAPDRLLPTRVELAGRFGEDVEVRAGLREGDEVVTSAAFLVDAESRIAGGAAPAEAPASPSPTTAPATGLAASDLRTVLEHYARLRDALTSGNTVGASTEAKALHGAARTLPQVTHQLKDFPKGLEDQRSRFKTLSEAVIQLATQHPEAAAGLQIVHCPMADARWLQPATGVRNPYYGKDMLECGTVQGPAGSKP